MSDERIRILRMVAQGKITPEEAERLLEALGDAADNQETRSSAGRRGNHGGFFGDFEAQFGDLSNRFGQMFSGFKDVFEGFDPFRKRGAK